MKGELISGVSAVTNKPWQGIAVKVEESEGVDTIKANGKIFRKAIPRTSLQAARAQANISSFGTVMYFEQLSVPVEFTVVKE